MALWVSFTLILVADVYYSSLINGNGFDGFVLALCFAFLAFIALAISMVGLDAAENIRRTADNTKRILEILNRKGKR